MENRDKTAIPNSDCGMHCKLTEAMHFVFRQSVRPAEVCKTIQPVEVSGSAPNLMPIGNICEKRSRNLAIAILYIYIFVVVVAYPFA